MIRSIIESGAEYEIKYPCIQISNTGYLVLFEKKKVGTVISDNRYHSLGDCSKDWNMESFKYFTGKVTLSNSSEEVAV